MSFVSVLPRKLVTVTQKKIFKKRAIQYRKLSGIRKKNC